MNYMLKPFINFDEKREERKIISCDLTKLHYSNINFTTYINPFPSNLLKNMHTLDITLSKNKQQSNYSWN